MGAKVPRLPPVFPAPSAWARQLQAGGIGVSVENPYYSHEVHGDCDVVSDRPIAGTAQNTPQNTALPVH